jgi:hypothetical protein
VVVVFGVFVFVESYIISIEFKNCSDVVVFKFFFSRRLWCCTSNYKIYWTRVVVVFCLFVCKICFGDFF